MFYCNLFKIQWASEPHCPLQQLGYARSPYLYLTRRRCKSRFRCIQPPSFFTWLKSVECGANSLHLAIMGHTERTRVVRIYAHNKGAFMQRLRLDWASEQAEMSFFDHTCPTRPVFSWQFSIWYYNARVTRVWYCTSDECGVTNRTCQLFRLSSISVWSTWLFYSRCTADLFIYCQLQLTVTSFSVFYFYYYCY